MNMNDLTTDLGKAVIDAVQSVFPDVPAEAIRYGGAALLGSVALVMVFFALKLLRKKSGSQRGRRVNVPRTLQREGGVIDILCSPADEDVPIRCVITSVAVGRIKCEIIERFDVLRAKEGREITCVFAPVRTDQGKVNAFHAKLIQSDRSGRRSDRIVLSPPTEYTLIPRRKHTRKRVADQQFLRVKLWVTDPHSTALSLEDAAPHIGVNSFASGGPDQAGNAVVNISNGGLGLSIVNRILPETCAVGSSVAINLFMFNFKEKSFKPYWYSGQVRSMKEGRPGFTRMGIEFDGTGRVNEKTGELRWEKF
jgi:hypothetical protein